MKNRERRRAIIGRAIHHMSNPSTWTGNPADFTHLGKRPPEKWTGEDWLIIGAAEIGISSPALFVAREFAEFFDAHWDTDESINRRRFDPHGRTLAQIEEHEGSAGVLATFELYLSLR